jgi:hypothetical protein
MQGLGSSIIGGLVAALTAYLVVRWTHRSNVRVSTEMDARSVVRSLTTDSLKVLADIQEMLHRDDEDLEKRFRRCQFEIRLVRMRFGSAFNASFPTIALVDRDIVMKTLSPLVNKIDGSFNDAEGHAEGAIAALESLIDGGAEAVLDAGNEMIESIRLASEQINDLLRDCANWLGDRK